MKSNVLDGSSVRTLQIEKGYIKEKIREHKSILESTINALKTPALSDHQQTHLRAKKWVHSTMVIKLQARIDQIDYRVMAITAEWEMVSASPPRPALTKTQYFENLAAGRLPHDYK